MVNQKQKMNEVLDNYPELTPAAHEAAMAVVALETDPNLQRAAEVGRAIDPEGVLPAVEVVPDPQYRVGRGSLVPQRSLIIHDGQKVGTCTLVSDNRGKARWFNGIEVDTKGAGFGSGTYKAVIQQAMRDGYDFQTHDWSQTEGAKNVWERLAEQGVAVAEEPFVPDGTGRFNGRYVIPAAGKQAER